MKRIDTRENADGDAMITLCSFAAANRNFGIETRAIREVLGNGRLTRVPLAPTYIGGVIAYRGDVLTTLSLRALLGMPAAEVEGRVLVLDEGVDGERFGLLVDSVGGVVSVPCQSMDPIPATLEEPMRSLFHGAFRVGQTLLVQLDPERLRPARLDVTALFRRPVGGGVQRASDMTCAP